MSVTPSADALIAHLDGEAVVLHAATKEYYRLNETAQIVWRMLEQRRSVADIASALAADYQVSAMEARTEVDRLIAELLAARLLLVAA